MTRSIDDQTVERLLRVYDKHPVPNALRAARIVGLGSSTALRILRENGRLIRRPGRWSSPKIVKKHLKRRYGA